MRDAGHIAPNGAAWGAITTALAPLEAAQFNELQAPTLLRLRKACIDAPHWPDASDQGYLALVGQPYDAQKAAQGGSALGWVWPSVLCGGQFIVWKRALDIAAALEDAIAQLRDDDSSVRVGAVCKTFGDAIALYDAMVLQPSLPFSGFRRGFVHINTLLYLADAITLLPSRSRQAAHARLRSAPRPLLRQQNRQQPRGAARNASAAAGPASQRAHR